MRVLLVEDNEKLALSVKKGLEKNGYAVDHIANGEEAADHIFINHASYDAILLDLMLPSRSGLDICTSVRERGITTPLIVITAKTETADVLQLLNAGADDYLTKPFAFEELLARLRAVTRRPNTYMGDELHLGDLRLVVSTHQVFSGTDIVSLTRKEFSILELFLRNQDTALTREFILDHVWDYQFDSESNIVDVHVKNLRKKLSHTSTGDIIETVTGVGYRCKK